MPTNMSQDQVDKLYAHINNRVSEMETKLENYFIGLNLSLERLIGNEKAGTSGRIDRLEAKQDELLKTIDHHEYRLVQDELKWNDYNALKWKIYGFSLGLGAASGTGAALLAKLFG